MKDEGTNHGRFLWQNLGDIAEGRPNLGRMAPVAVYRLHQYTIREAISKAHGPEEARRLLVEAGRIAGREFCRNLLDVALAPGPFLSELQRLLREWGMGILRVEQADFEGGRYVLTIAEDLDCSGLSVTDETVCDYDEGFFAGVFREYTGREFQAREIDCWASGDRVCRFQVRPMGADDGA